MFQTIFKRYENKYLLNENQYFAVLEVLKVRAVPDKYGKSTVCSIYYDTPDKRLIRVSIEKPVYKEKLRLRSYGVPSGSTDCFLELKKKYKGVVYKRRIVTSYLGGGSGMAQSFSGDSSQASFMYTLDSSAKAGDSIADRFLGQGNSLIYALKAV